MIVRIMAEGQYRLRASQLDRLNRWDNRVVEAVAKRNDARYRAVYKQMLDFVRERGEQVAATELVESDVVLPAADLTLEEASKLFVGEGVVPG